MLPYDQVKAKHGEEIKDLMVKINANIAQMPFDPIQGREVYNGFFMPAFTLRDPPDVGSVVSRELYEACEKGVSTLKSMKNEMDGLPKIGDNNGRYFGARAENAPKVYGELDAAKLGYQIDALVDAWAPHKTAYEEKQNKMEVAAREASFDVDPALDVAPNRRSEGMENPRAKQRIL